MKAQLYRVNGRSGAFLMIAPLSTISDIFNLHRDAIARVERETAEQGSCNLHFNGRAYLREPSVTVSPHHA